MPAESTAVLLRRAAAHLDELAKGTTPGPWTWHTFHAVDELVHEPPTPSPVHPWNVLKVSHEDWPANAADKAWMATMSPVVAAPLAEWLRAEAHLADLCDARPDPIAEQLGIDQAALAPFDSPAVALARALLGETEAAP